MRKMFFLLFLFYSLSLFADCKKNKFHFPAIFHRIHQVFTIGSPDLYLTGYAWHNRFAYDPLRVKQYNEAAWGGGFGKGLFDEKGNWRGLYAIAFLDSHRHIEPALGYSYLKMKDFSSNLKAGIGYTVLLTVREDINGGLPFPGILPGVSISYKKATLSAAYIPGALDAGNVLFIISRFRVC